MIIDASNLILGRLGSFAAKRALLGDQIDVVNCEKAVITGRKATTIDKYKTDMEKGTNHGPFWPKQPERFVRRAIRGMLPHKKDRGRKAFALVKCYIGVPKEFEGKEMTTVKGADVSKIPNAYYMDVRELCKRLGARID